MVSIGHQKKINDKCIVFWITFFFQMVKREMTGNQCVMSHSIDILLKQLIWIVRQWNCVVSVCECVFLWWHFHIIHWIWTTLVIWLNKHHWNIHNAQFQRMRFARPFSNGNGNNVRCDNCSPESQVLYTNIHQYIQMVVNREWCFSHLKSNFHCCSLWA